MITLTLDIPEGFEFISLHHARAYNQKYHVCLRILRRETGLYTYRVGIADSPAVACAACIALLQQAAEEPPIGRDDWRSRPLVKGHNTFLRDEKSIAGLDLTELKLDL